MKARIITGLSVDGECMVTADKDISLVTSEDASVASLEAKYQKLLSDHETLQASIVETVKAQVEVEQQRLAKKYQADLAIEQQRRDAHVQEALEQQRLSFKSATESVHKNIRNALELKSFSAVLAVLQKIKSEEWIRDSLANCLAEHSAETEVKVFMSSEQLELIGADVREHFKRNNILFLVDNDLAGPGCLLEAGQRMADATLSTKLSQLLQQWLQAGANCD